MLHTSRVSVVRRLATHLVRAHHLADGAQSSVVRYRRVKEASVAVLWLSQLVPRAHRSALHAQNFEGTVLARAHLVHGSASVRPRPRTPVRDRQALGRSTVGRVPRDPATEVPLEVHALGRLQVNSLVLAARIS